MQAGVCFLVPGAIGYLALLGIGIASGGFPQFREHQINPDSSFTSCAASDVNHDGKLDIVSGGFWYEAPDWKRHFLREVEVIRGRFDDYSNLPLDVNGDGWTDLISANYRSQKLYWIEHPGQNLGPWKAHVIDEPGPMETAILADVDGDGVIDVLPNGTKFAAWWELVRGKQPDGAMFKWVRHNLPDELIGHGIGIGDLNHDGRQDLITTQGWAEAPVDRRAGRWIWHAEFSLPRDGTIPILAFDVDSDSDNDLVFTRAHHTGIYWLEQVAKASPDSKTPTRTWNFHAIDTSWSQSHALLLGDLDQDGRPEVIAGKRYMGHDGRDLGEYDPMQIWAYSFNQQRKTWQRNPISFGGRGGFDLDPKLVDLDADGDLDIIGPTRGGLSWFENLLRSKSEKAASQPQVPAVRQYQDHANLLSVLDELGQLRPVKDNADWGLRRADILANMERVMGRLPEPSLRVPLELRVEQSTETDNYVRQTISFAAEPGDRVPAYLLIPKQITRAAPAMLCLHQTTAIGKGEPAGLGGKRNLHYAHELALRGYICLVPDYPSFGDYKYDFRQTDGSTPGLPYRSGSMKAIWNNHRAVDLLESLPQVDRERIGVIGHSLGGHNALFTAAFDQRLKAVVTSCGFTAFHDYYGGKLQGWTSDRYMPKIREEFGNDPNRVPFDFYEVLAAIAPRAIFVNAPVRDSNFDIGGVKKIERAVSQVYQLVDAPNQLRFEYPEAEHDFPEPVRRDAYEWLDARLK